MTFDEILAQVTALLQRQGRVSYRALKLRFSLDDEHLAALQDELIDAQRLARDEDGKVLVWRGNATPTLPVREPEPAPLAYTPPYLTEKILTARSALEGERKQVTVLFADLKGSTELIKDLDPEAAQQLLDPAIQRMMDAVHRYEGTVNQVLGDGIMALFGAPLAHEDHAIRACYAALAMQASLHEYAETVRRAQGLSLRIRVGLNSGEVVVRTIRNDLHMDYSAVGRETHLAARMEQLAAPGSMIGTPERAVEYGERACAIAAALEDVGLQMSSTLSLGQAYVTMGHYRQAADCLSRAIDALQGDLRYQRLGAPAVRAVSSRAWLAWSLAELGEFAEGMAPGAEAIQMAEAAGHPYSLIQACYGHGLLHLRRGDLTRAIPVLERGLGICQDWGLHALSFHGVASFLGAAYVLAGRVAEALPLLEQVVQQTNAMGVVFDHVLGVIPLGEGYLRAGRIEDALHQARHAVEVCRQHQQRGHEAWALRLLGEVAAQHNPPEVESAEAHYRQALALADELGMRPLQAHCHLGLGTLHAKTASRNRPAPNWLPPWHYRAMDMPFWLPQAEAVLAQIA